MPVWMIVIEWSARLVFLILIALSMWSVKIILERRKYFAELLNETPAGNWENELSSINTSEMTPQKLWQKAYTQIAKENKAENIERSFETFILEQKNMMNKGLSILGTLGATAPFIGLFGTVLGIINAFGDLSLNSQNTNKVMFLLAEALILTAMGLLVAIPAVIAFNVFKQKLNRVLERLNAMKNTYQNSKN